jgi:regulator of sigma E protease
MIVSILLIIVIFSSVVFVHEFGHFMAARRGGIEVEEFGFGFPPRLIGIKRGRTIYSINWLPLGGFVRMKGEDQNDNSKGAFAAAKLNTKVKVLVAGVVMNLLMGYLILTMLALTGLPRIIDGQFRLGPVHYAQEPAVLVVEVVKDSPAAKAGIKTGDLVIAGNGQKFNSESDLTNFTKNHAGETVTLELKQDGTRNSKLIQLNSQSGSTGYLGVTPLRVESQRYGWLAPIVAAGISLQLIWRTLLGFVGLIGGLVVHHQASADVAGPVGIVVILSNVIHLGWSYVWVFVLSICFSLAVINILPIPALDGGRLAITLIRARYKKLPIELENQINKFGFVALLVLMALVTVIDIRRFL